ncbi:hypothetical protein [Aquimarina brevivitae]|uniref:Lipoprotein n=1 Tax=Aquimarina brevivitae TaxID=323412 RepID=A0A4Q7NYY6_9FLAO|nr:hypothetical protein [Aquimarina brevivitae]RZS92467.1 hypothetical protein EV197_2605 [Aquimarina brevivitae]
MKNIFLKPLLPLFFAFLLVLSCKQDKKDGYGATDEVETLLAFAPVHDILPTDVKPSCTIDSTSFGKWFTAGKVTKNGVVAPANSVTFGHQNNCDFYTWSEQMFLWITSPKEDGNYKQGTIMETPMFYTVSTLVDGKRTLIPHEAGKPLSALANVQKTDTIIDTEEGQATDDVLMAKNGSLIYYISMVNDVYAQFLTGAKDGQLNGNEFPTSKSAMDSIVNYASSQGVQLSNPETLAMELKTSWVDASTIPNAQDYITIDAIIPVYDKVSDTLWRKKPDTTATAKLALIGIHIVGSANGHPEMIWSTFEHKDNTPNLSYEYINVQDSVKTVAADTGNDWLLNSDSSNGTYNVSHMTFKDDNIIAKTGQTISPSNTKRNLPWGVLPSGQPNPENATAAASNAQVISINNSVLGQLADGDMRKNYIFIGSTWTNNGLAPTGTAYNAGNPKPGMSIGTSQLANSTMETYFQNDPQNSNGFNCFTCHSNPGNGTGLKPADLSHMYEAIQALNTNNMQ